MFPAYFAAFAVTLAVEVPIYVAALTVLVGVRPGRAVLLAVGVNIVTHPAVWWTLRPLATRPAYPVIVGFVEVGVCVVEWALLLAFTRKSERARLSEQARESQRTRAEVVLLAAISVAANAASTLVGLLLHA